LGDSIMSKVKIQGNASGTGVLTVTAPNTSTDRTITLPDSTGELLSTAGGTMTGDLVVSADVDITGSLNGTSGALDIKNEANNQNIFIKTTSAGSELTALKIHSGGVLELPSGGLRVGGTAAANTLDDYEEGTWTAGLQGANQSGMNTTGYYTKIGRQVFFQWYSGGMTISSASGPAKVTGLPFTSSNASSAYGLFIYLHGNGVDGGSTGGYVQDVDTTFRFVDTNNITDASYVNGTKYIMVSGSYFVS